MKPKNKEAFDRRRGALLEPSIIHSIDGLFESECETVIAAYHGSYVRAGLYLLGHGIRGNIHGAYWSLVFRIGDWMRWTILRPIPGTPYFERHSSKCDKMNCSDVDCVQIGIPRWYRRLTRMDHDL